MAVANNFGKLVDGKGNKWILYTLKWIDTTISRYKTYYKHPCILKCHSMKVLSHELKIRKSRPTRQINYDSQV